MMTALEAALAAQSSKYTTVSQQLRMELKEALAKAHKVGSCAAGFSPHLNHTTTLQTPHNDGNCTCLIV